MILVAAFFVGILLQDPAETKPPQQEKPIEPLPPTLATDEPADSELHFTFLPGLRFGGWFMGSFQATTPLGGRKIESTFNADIGIDLRAEYGGWSLALTADHALGADMSATIGGLLVGKCWQLGESPHFVQVAAGPVFGKYDVSTPGFGDFKSGAGGVVRVSTTVEVHDLMELMLWLDYRQISFDYDETVLSGDKRVRGASFAVGAGLLLRF